MKRSGFNFVLLKFVVGCLCFSSSTATAVIDCSTTTTLLLNGADPTDNFTTDSDDPNTPCIEIRGHGVSDFTNRTITCTDTTNGCDVAIRFTNIDGTSTVRGATITGPFRIGIDGSAATSDEIAVADGNKISGLRTDGGATAIYDVDLVKGNVIIGYDDEFGSTSAGVSWFPSNNLSGAATAQVVEDNYVDCQECSAGILADSSYTGGTVPKVRRNFVRVVSPNLSFEGEGKVNVENNIFVSGEDSVSGDPFSIDGNVVVGNNLCDQLIDAADANDPLCSEPPTPFDLP